jgi:FAD:protein FMN transferase
MRAPAPPEVPAERRFTALGTSAVIVVTDPRCADDAAAAVADEVAACDAACSRFRDDSELAVLNRSPGRGHEVTPWLFDALSAALRAAQLTDGLVDPTVGRTLSEIGYDRDFDSVPPDGPPLKIRVRRPRRWQGLRLDADARTAWIPDGVELDLGATAKALCADRAAVAAHEATGCPVLVSLGGDIAVSGGAPDGGWIVHVTDDHRTVADDDSDDPDGQNVTLYSGGLATSGVTARRWSRGGIVAHHIVDPRSGEPAEVVWRTVTVAADTCVEANIASTASIILGQSAPAWLAQRCLPARLVTSSGSVTAVAGWPAEPGAPC